MSLNIAILAISGNHLADAKRILNVYGYDIVSTHKVRNAIDAQAAVNKQTRLEIVTKLAYVDAKWTIILDFEMAMPAEVEACQEIGAQLESRVFGIISVGTAETYGFFDYASTGMRNLMYSNGKVIEDIGPPIPEEDKLSSQPLTETSLFTLFASIVAPYDEIGIDRDYRVFELTPTGTVIVPLVTQAQSKPCWKFW